MEKETSWSRMVTSHTYAGLEVITEAKASLAWTEERSGNIATVMMAAMYSSRTLVDICTKKQIQRAKVKGIENNLPYFLD